MGDRKKTYCKRGLHLLAPGNLYFNAEGFRQCKACSKIRWKAYNRAVRLRMAGRG